MERNVGILIFNRSTSKADETKQTVEAGRNAKMWANLRGIKSACSLWLIDYETERSLGIYECSSLIHRPSTILSLTT